jgi:hypothetical protein
MRGPIIFLCEDGIGVFRDGAHAVSYAEAIDVRAGVYGEHGWDSDGRPITLEVRPPKPRLLMKIFGFPVTIMGGEEVTIRQLDAPPEPDVLFSVLLEFWLERDPSRAASLSSSSLEELVESIRPFSGR